MSMTKFEDPTLDDVGQTTVSGLETDSGLEENNPIRPFPFIHGKSNKV